MKLDKVLLLYKRSAYRIYFLDKKSSISKKRNPIIYDELTRFEKAHEEHYNTLHSISKILFTHGVRFDENYRGRNVNYDNYDLIITVGGDGTFLEAARRLKKQVIIGVNSAPNYSVGRFCIANINNFEKILMKIINKKYQEKLYHRIRLSFKGKNEHYDALNDVLICHRNPAVLCRYYLQAGKRKEEQRSSGIWVSTPVGSTGAIRSAGAKLLSPYQKVFQYKPRELYPGKNGKYQLTGGVLKSTTSLNITSLMRKGMVFFDGAHQKVSFEYGDSMKISMSPHPIRTLKIKK